MYSFGFQLFEANIAYKYGIKKPPKCNLGRLFAEREGFEPPEALTSTVFKTAAIDHSAISPDDSLSVSKLRRGRDSNSWKGYPFGSLANCWFQPLTHLSRVALNFSFASAKLYGFSESAKYFARFF